MLECSYLLNILLKFSAMVPILGQWSFLDVYRSAMRANLIQMWLIVEDATLFLIIFWILLFSCKYFISLLHFWAKFKF